MSTVALDPSGGGGGRAGVTGRAGLRWAGGDREVAAGVSGEYVLHYAPIELYTTAHLTLPEHNPSDPKT